jgi:hypothetical protein
LKLHDTFIFPRTPFDLKMVTPLLSGAALRARSSKSWRAGRVHDQHGVRNNSLNWPRFYARIQVQFLFLPRLCFLLFTLWISPNFYVSPRSLFQIHHDSFVLSNCFSAFKMGVKNVWTGTILWFSPRYFLLHHDAFVFHRCLIFRRFTNSLISTYMPLFLHLRQDNLFLPRCPFLLCHDTFVFTAPPFLCCTTIFLISPSCPSFGASRYLHFCTNFFRLNAANNTVSISSPPARSAFGSPAYSSEQN